jgi:CBS domain-containing protein
MSRKEYRAMNEAVSTSVGTLMVPEFDTITPEEPIVVARRRMEAETRRSLIVVDADRPVGIIEWRRLQHVDAPANTPVGEVMVREFPILTPNMSVADAQMHLADVDVDRIPVVDESGRLIGEVPRTSLSKFEVTTAAGAGAGVQSPGERDTVASTSTSTSTDVPAVPTDGLEGVSADEAFAAAVSAPAPEVREGMTAVGSGGSKLGEVDQIIVESTGTASAFTVKHGFLSKKHKKIPMDSVDHVEGDTVVLAIDQSEFKMLRDEEDAM